MDVSKQLHLAGSVPADEMIFISGGAFRMGSDNHYPEEAPVHRVGGDGLWIDPTPVTNRQFRALVKATGGPQKCFPNLASFRQVDAESEIAFSKKYETFQESQGILSPLRLPVPTRPLWPRDQRLSAFSGEVELG